MCFAKHLYMCGNKWLRLAFDSSGDVNMHAGYIMIDGMN